MVLSLLWIKVLDKGCSKAIVRFKLVGRVFCGMDGGKFDGELVPDFPVAGNEALLVI